MAALFRKLAPAVLFASSGIGMAAAQQIEAPEGIELAATEAYVGTSRVDFEGVRISQGDLTIEADRATSNALDAEQNEWHLRGNVRVRIGSATIESDEAHFTLQDAKLSMFELRGDPATFEDPGAEPSETGRGGAEVLAYDADTGTLSLRGNAWLALGTTEVMGCDLIYDVDENAFRSGSTECDEDFHIRISRSAEDADADGPTPTP